MSAPAPSALMTMRILWGSFLTTPPLLVFVLHSMIAEGGSAPFEAAPLPLLALGFAVAAPLARFKLLGGTLAITPAGDDDLTGVPRPTLARYQTALILGMALSEGVSIVGLLHGFTAGSVQPMLPYVALSLLLMLPQIPTAAGVRMVR